MKKVKKILLLLGLLIGIFACSTLPTESDDLEASQGKGSVNFALSGVSSTNSNILFSTATNSEDTPKRVSISYRKSGATSEATNSMELSAFGSSFVLADPISLEAGDYEVTKFDVLSSSGKTIYSTPMTGSVIDDFLNISTSLAYAFTITAGESKEINMQVVGVNEDSKASDFGRDAFTYELITYSEFYIAAYLQDEEYALTATPATLTIKNPSGTTITNKNLLAEKNRILVADYDSYTFIVSKDSLTKSFTISKSELAKYKKEALKVIFFATPHAYKLINKNMTWSEAKAYCEGLDGYLVTITSQEENNYIADSILAPNNYPGCWAGGSDSETEGTWKWITGEDWTYSNWTDGEPNNEKNNENYLHLGLNPNNNKWNDYVGSYALYFICEWNSEADMLDAYKTITYDANGGSGSVPTVATTKLDEVTIASGSNLSKAGYTFIGWSTNSSATSITYTAGQKVKFTSSTTLYAVWKNNSLYKFINEKMTWSEAKAYCEGLGGHLVTIASQEENNYIAENILVPNGAPGCWAGGTDRETEKTWKWVTGEAWTYNNWAVGEPNNWGDEDYLQIFGSNCNWNDGYETTLLPFICEWENEADIIKTFYIEALILNDSTWNYTDANLNIVNEKGTTIYNNSISGAKNKIKVSNENLKITVSKDGYVPQTFNFTKDSLANYETTALQVKLEYNSFYIEALTTEDGSTWNYTNANLNIVNGEGTSIYNKTISGAKNKITVSNENLYKITISKDGYVSQTFNFTKDSLANYETTALKVKLQEVTYDFYIEALTSEDNTTWNYTNANLNIVNGEGTSIYSNAINGEKNKITVSNENLYKITISKDGYFPQTFNFTKDSLANYENEAMVVKLKKNTNISTEGLIAYYPFNGNANDESGTGNDGTECGGIDYVDGKIGKCAKFDGVDDYIIKSSFVPSNSNYAVSIWFKTSSLKRQSIIGEGYSSDGRAITICNGKITIHKANFGDEYVFSGNYADGNWHNIVLNNLGNIYIDSVLKGVVSKDIFFQNNLLIGKWAHLDYGKLYMFNGSIDDIRIYNRALSQEEITALYNAGN